MRAVEFITERAGMDPGVDKALLQKGYKKLGKGVDQNVYLEPGTGLILKIFRSSPSGEGSDRITPGQNTFKAFANYCMKHPNNPFLPQFYGWETFKFNNRIYLQIRMERLFDFKSDDDYSEEYWKDFLEDLATAARFSIEPASSRDNYKKEMFIKNRIENDEENDASTSAEMFSMLGPNGLNMLWDTIHDLSMIAEKGGFKLDLHGGNFMMGSDGHIVISDPFFLGWNHPDLEGEFDNWDAGDDTDSQDSDTTDGSDEINSGTGTAPKATSNWEPSDPPTEQEPEDEPRTRT